MKNAMYRYAETPRNMDHRKMASKSVLEDCLYKGTIKPELVNSSSDFDQLPGKNNPYRYYGLSPDYYDFSRKQTKYTPIVHVSSPSRGQTYSPELRQRHSTQPKQGQQQHVTVTKSTNVISPTKKKKSNKCCCWTSKKQIHPERNRRSEMASQRQPSRAGVLIRNIDDMRVNTPNVINKQRKGDNLTTLSKRGEFKSSDPATTFPATILQSGRGKDPTQVMSPETMAFNPLYKETTKALFPPLALVPVALEDYSRSVPVKRVSSKTLITGNPLIPVMVPAERLTDNDLYSSRYSPVSTAFYVQNDYEHDSFYRRYTDIPSYNAVGFVLNDTDVYSD